MFESHSLTNGNLRAFLETNGFAGPWPRKVWRLDELTYVAFFYHPDLALAHAQWESAFAAEVTAGQRPNPSFTANPGYDWQIPGAPSPWILPFNFDIPIETAGKRRYRLEQAEHQADAAYWRWVGTVWHTRNGVRTALLDFDAAQKSRALLGDQAAAQSNVVRLLQGQMTAGAASGFDLTHARVAYDTTRLSLQDADGRWRQARAALATALGLPVQALSDAIFESPEPSEASRLTRPAVRERALRERSDVQAALADYAASQSGLQLAIAGQFPDVHLGPGYAWNTGSAGDNEYVLGLTVSLPVFNHNQGPIAEALAQRRQSAAAFLSAQSQVIGQIDAALSAYQAAWKESRVAAELMSELDQRLRSVRVMAQAGEVDPLALANAEVEFSSGAILRLDATVKAQQALARLEDAMQSPLTLSEQAVRTARDQHAP